MNEISKKILEGNIRTASHLIRNIEDKMPETDEIMKEIFKVKGNSHVIGLTGAPGAGKSTLTDEIITAFRKKNNTIGVLAVDPTSPFTGGAILGDRIRMMSHASDKDVFVRSLATRGATGGLSKAVGEAIYILEAMGKDKVIVETCGVGQQEVDIIDHAQTVVVVLVPGMGDEVQAIKAGLMEIADIFVINKADRDGADKLYRELINMISMSSKKSDSNLWEIPVLRIGNFKEPKKFSEEVEKLCNKIEEHYEYLYQNKLLSTKIRQKTKAEFKEALWAKILEPILNNLIEENKMESMIDKLTNKETDPYTLAEEVAKQYLI
ncbi:MAG: methylmalonyl Co-A mutase-associated GTPase MeaB [Bacillota bacterium]|nr:methylmalonyl Co-A mutase-associated GTPase MeaB [Bacillota bacterium]